MNKTTVKVLKGMGEGSLLFSILLGLGSLFNLITGVSIITAMAGIIVISNIASIFFYKKYIFTLITFTILIFVEPLIISLLLSSVVNKTLYFFPEMIIVSAFLKVTIGFVFQELKGGTNG